MPGRSRAAYAFAGIACAWAWLGCAGGARTAAETRPEASAEAAPAPKALPFALPGTTLTATAEARGVRFEPDSGQPGQSVAHFDLGEANPAVCSFSPRSDARALAAHLLTAVVAGAMQSFSADAAPELASRVRAGVVGHAPFLSLDVGLRRDDRMLVVFQRLAVRHERVVHCVLVAGDAGAALDRLFTSLVQTLAIDPTPPAPAQGFAYSVHVDGEPVGVIEVTLAQEPSGAWRMERRSAVLMPTQDGGRLPIDEVHVERTRRDGTLLEARTERHEAFGSPTALALEPAGPRAWRVHGTLGETAVDERFAADPPSSYLRYLRAVRDAARRRRVGVAIRERSWTPDLAVGAFSEAVTTLEETETGALRGSERLGSAVFTFAVDANGLPDSGWIQRGAVRIEQRRERAFGEIPDA